MDERQVLTLEEAAQYLRLSMRTVRRDVERGDLPVIRYHRRLMFDLEDLNRFLDTCRVSSSPGDQG